jgi:hypothetical protein
VLCACVGCVDALTPRGSITFECRPVQLITVYGVNFGSGALLELQSSASNNASYTLTPYQFITGGFTVRLPSAISPVDFNRPLNATVYIPSLSQRSAVYPGGVTMTGVALVLQSVWGCAFNRSVGTSVGTFGCMAGQLVTVNGSGFSETMQLLVAGEAGGACQLRSTHLTCPLTLHITRPDLLWLNAQLVSGSALSNVLASAVQFTPTPSVDRVTGCLTSNAVATFACSTGTRITVMGSGFMNASTVNLLYNSTYARYSIPCLSPLYNTSTSLVCTLPSAPYLYTVFAVQVNNSYDKQNMLGPLSGVLIGAVNYGNASSSSTGGVRLSSSGGVRLNVSSSSTGGVRLNSTSSSSGVRLNSSSSAARPSSSSSAVVAATSVPSTAPVILSIAGCVSGPNSATNCSANLRVTIVGYNFGSAPLLSPRPAHPLRLQVSPPPLRHAPNPLSSACHVLVLVGVGR